MFEWVSFKGDESLLGGPGTGGKRFFVFYTQYIITINIHGSRLVAYLEAGSVAF